MLSAPACVNHIFPSGPATMLLTVVAGAVNSVTTPLELMRPIWLEPGCVNHMPPGPGEIPRGLLLAVMPEKNSVLVGAGAGTRRCAGATGSGPAEFDGPLHAAMVLAKTS